MTYSIQEAAKITNLTSYTLRYYDKKGLLPFVKRDANGIRKFEEKDIEWLSIIGCLRSTGMPIKEVRQFIEYCIAKDETGVKGILIAHQKNVEKQISDLQEGLKNIEWKIEHYQIWCE